MELAQDRPVMLRILSTSVHIAARAGAEVRRIIKSGKLNVVDKGIQDYQTEADRLVQRMIISNLARIYPMCKIVGEEELKEDREAEAKLVIDGFDEDVLKKSLPEKYQSIREEDLTIWVDPLDGTTEFVKGFLENVTVLIGISFEGNSIAGVIHQPFYGYSREEPAKVLEGRTMWGVVDMGCFGVTPNDTLPDDKLIITTTSSHGNQNIDDAINALKPDQIIRIGGAGNKVLMVIEGRAHAYVFASSGCKRWDTCAPEAILRSLGGCLTDVFGKQIVYQHNLDYQNHLGIIASINPKIHSLIMDKIPGQIGVRLLELQSKNLKSKY